MSIFYPLIFTWRMFCDRIGKRNKRPPLAQLDRVPDSDSDGRGFESRRAGKARICVLFSVKRVLMLIDVK